jgi:hypothetical protein
LVPWAVKAGTAYAAGASGAEAAITRVLNVGMSASLRLAIRRPSATTPRSTRSVPTSLTSGGALPLLATDRQAMSRVGEIELATL